MAAVTVSLYGGLGNQLFQYAVARALAERIGSDLVLDLSWFDAVTDSQGITVRKYALDPFSIKASVSNEKPHSRMLATRIWHRIAAHFNWLHQLTNNTRNFYEKSFQFDPEVLKIENPVWFRGYWQSYKYFDDISAILRNEIGTEGAMSAQSAKLLADIRNCDAICIHVRRGDYITNKNAAQYHGLCGLPYYTAALEIVSKELSDPHGFVFSDDPEWVRDNFSMDIPMTVVDVNGPDDAHQDLWLMAACRRFVIANSSMSWWAAWLGVSPDKQVVAPAQWFVDGNIDTSDLIPEDWIRA